MKNKSLFLLTLAGVLVSAAAEAHISVVGGMAYANKSQVIEFSVGHGCDGADTYAVDAEIPKGMTSVRPMFSDFGMTSTVTDPADATIVTNVIWQKPIETALDSDSNYYKLAARMKVPDEPFTTVYFKIHQTCRAADGTLAYADWVALPGEVGEAAAALNILPARLPGWNKYTVPVDVPDMSVFFQDALIVWRGSEAYSYNDATIELINGTEGASLISDGLHAGDEIWVRY